MKAAMRLCSLLPQCGRRAGDEGKLALLVAVGGRGEERFEARDLSANPKLRVIPNPVDYVLCGLRQSETLLFFHSPVLFSCLPKTQVFKRI